MTKKTCTTNKAVTHAFTRHAQNRTPETEPEPENGQKPSIGVDVANYQEFLDDVDIPEDQKDALIQTLWAIIVQFVDLGFGVHPVQQAQSTIEPEVEEPLRKAVRAFAQEQKTKVEEIT